jgi:adenylate cyclase
LVRRIYRETEGNPFFVIEIVKALFQMGMIHLEGGVWRGDFVRISETRLPLPFSVSELIGARVGRLSEGAQEALRLASVLGREFDFGPLQAAGRWSVDETLDAVDVLLRQRLIEEGGRGATGRDYAFTHHKIHEVVLAGMDPRRRGHLHAQVGEAIERLHSAELETVAAELAHHFLEAGELEPALTAKAVAYLTLAGEAAAGAQALAEARAYYARALEALEGLPDTEENRTRRFDTLLDILASTWRSDVAQCVPHLEEAERLVEGVPDPDGMRRAQLHFFAGRVYIGLGKAQEAIGYYRQVLPVAKELDDAEMLAVPSSAIGQALAIRGRLDQAEPLLREAMSLFEGLGNWSEWIRATGFHSWTLVGMGEGEAEVGIAQAERALARARELDYPSDIALSYANLSKACLFAGDPSRAQETAEGMVEAGERSGDRGYCYLGWGFRSWAEAHAGRYQEAVASMAQRQEIRAELGPRIVLDDCFAAVNAEIALGAGRFQEALELAEGAVGVARAFGGLISEAWARRVWGQALAALAPPRWEEAEAQLAESVRLLESGQVRLWVARTRVAWGVICRDRGDPAEAREHWGQAAAQFERSGLTAELDRVRGLLKALE